MALVLSACAGGAPRAPAAIPVPHLEVADASVEGEYYWTVEGGILPPPDEPVVPLDPILDSPWGMDPQLQARVDYWVERFRVSRALNFPLVLARMGRYQEVVDREIQERGLPRSLRYLPVIESGYYTNAVSRAGATGLWQLMDPTARSLGLRVNPILDERRDPYASTGVALDYLQELNQRFHSWYLTLAAYNAGPFRVESIIRRHAPGAPLEDATFWRISPHLPAETRDFIPKFLAAARLGEDPIGHGLEVLPHTPVAYDLVSVPDATSVDVLARVAGSSQEEIQALNPQLVRGLTPAGTAVTIRIPAGHKALFDANYAALPPAERVTFVEHRIARGETLGALARLYGVSLSDIQATNPRANPRRLQIGQVIIIPRAGVGVGGTRVAAAGAAGSPGTGSASSSGSGSPGENGEAGPPRETTHTVRPGESLWTIARRHGVRVADLQAWNGLRDRDVIRAGQRLTIRAGGEGAPRSYLVQRGDTLGRIASRHGVTSAALAQANGLSLTSVIRPGDRLRIP